MSAPGLIDKYARSLVSSALRRGCALEDLCQAASIAQQTYLSEDQHFNAEELARLSRHVKLLMDDEFCGMTRQRCRAGTFFLIGELILPSKTLREALDKAFRFYDLNNDGIKFDLITGSERCDIRIHVMEPQLNENNFLGEWYLLLWRHFSGWLIGEEIPVLQTRFAHPQLGSTQEYARVFDSECLFDQAENRIRFRDTYLDQPIVKNMEDIQDYWSVDRIDLESHTGVASTFKSRLRAQLRDYFFETQKFYAMEAIASKYNLSTPSLRRRLEEEGTTFRQIKEDIRREAALTWLRDTQLSVAEISRMCGFAESNGLSRAMKSWVGMSPSEYRRT